MDRVHEGVHGTGPQGWSMDLGSMFCIRPDATRCIRLATLFDTFQQQPAMLDTLARPGWVNENILELLTQQHTCHYNSKFKKLGPIL